MMKLAPSSMLLFACLLLLAADFGVITNQIKAVQVAAFTFIQPLPNKNCLVQQQLAQQPSTMASTTTCGKPSRHYYSNKLYSSTSSGSGDNNDEGGDEGDVEEPVSDELSKLIGRRASISKMREDKLSTASTTPPPVPDGMDSIGIDATVPKKSVSDGGIEASDGDDFPMDSAVASLYEGKSGMDIFNMPELKTKRPLREDDEDDDGGKTGKDNEGYIDYQVDYEDENELHIPNRLGFDTIAWGDSTMGFKGGKKLKKRDIKRGKFLLKSLREAYKKLMDAGITLAVTSEHYALASRRVSLSSEEILAQFAEGEKTSANPLFASTMVGPYKSFRKGTGLRIGQFSIVKAIEGSAERLGVSSIDMYRVPSRMFYIGMPPVVIDGLIKALDQGLINGVGTMNMSKASMKRFSGKLNKRGGGGYSLTSNTFEFSLVNRKAYKSGLIAACKALGVIPIVSNPLGNGLASGVFTLGDPTGGQISGDQPFSLDTLEKWSPLHRMMGTVQEKVKKRLEIENRSLSDRRNRYGGKSINSDVTTTQIAINYVVAKGCVPIPPVTNAKEVDELIGCLGWGLTDEEVQILDEVADLIKV